MNLVKKFNKLCSPMKLYALLASFLLLINLNDKEYTTFMRMGVDMLVVLLSSGLIMKLCENNNLNLAYGVICVYIVFWGMWNSIPDVEKFQKCQPVVDNTVNTDFCNNKYGMNFKDRVGGVAGASETCSEQAELCNVAKYYNKRADWIQQQDLSMPDGPPTVASNCSSKSPSFDKPCSALDTPATKLRNYPINTDTHQPNYRSCYENPLKVQTAYDASIKPYEQASRV